MEKLIEMFLYVKSLERKVPLSGTFASEIYGRDLKVGHK